MKFLTPLGFVVSLVTIISMSLAGCSTEAPLAGYSSLTEEFPSIKGDWVRQVLSETNADGIFVLEQDGDLTTSRFGGHLTSAVNARIIERENLNWSGEYDFDSDAVIAQCFSPVILVEPGCQYESLLIVLRLCSYLPEMPQVYVTSWSQDVIISQVTKPQVSNYTNYPDYGLRLLVEVEVDNEGRMGFRWGNPKGFLAGGIKDEVYEKPYAWTSVQGIEELVRQLEGKFEYDKTIHLEPTGAQEVLEVLEIVEYLHGKGFLYVDFF